VDGAIVQATSRHYTYIYIYGVTHTSLVFRHRHLPQQQLEKTTETSARGHLGRVRDGHVVGRPLRRYGTNVFARYLSTGRNRVSRLHLTTYRRSPVPYIVLFLSARRHFARRRRLRTRASKKQTKKNESLRT